MITRRQFMAGGLGALLAVQVSELQNKAQAADGAVKGLPVRQALSRRRTIRDFSKSPVSFREVGELLWAAQGITEPEKGFRTAPSAGALFPLELFVFCGDGTVSGLDRGIYRYLPKTGQLARLSKSDSRNDLARICVNQMWVAEAPVILVISSVYPRITKKYGSRGIRFAMIESGCAAQNIFVMAEELGLGAGIVGAFKEGAVMKLIPFETRADPLLVMPVGHRA